MRQLFYTLMAGVAAAALSYLIITGAAPTIDPEEPMLDANTNFAADAFVSALIDQQYRQVVARR